MAHSILLSAPRLQPAIPQSMTFKPGHYKAIIHQHLDMTLTLSPSRTLHRTLQRGRKAPTLLLVLGEGQTVGDYSGLALLR